MSGVRNIWHGWISARVSVVGVAGLTLLSACNGVIGAPGGGADDGASGPGTTTGAGPSSGSSIGPPLRSSAGRRLSRREFKRSIQRLIGPDAPVDITILPDDTFTPFDNDVAEQSPSMLLVESAESIAHNLADWVVGAPDRLQRVVPCTPQSATDAACFEQFVKQFGKRVLRRPLDQDEVTSMLELLSYAKAPGQFSDAVSMALRLFLMHPEFIYRVEPGVSVADGKVRLSPYEVATRLSFVLQGVTPDDTLLTAADSGTLDTSDGILGEAKRLLAAEEGKVQLRRFHALWLGYSKLDTLPLQIKLRAESDALVDRATESTRDYLYLLRADETNIDAELATHYGLAPPASGFDWVSYGDARRRGIISQGMFAAAGAKFGDTSPTRRGKFIRERFLCQPVPLPKVNVDVDMPPMQKTANACKVDRYREHRADAVCAGCHGLMDPIGFGLENFDELGRYRDHDKDRPECPIDGVGQLDETTPFTGAKELATIVAGSPALEPCLGQYFIRFAAGRKLDDTDVLSAPWLADEMHKSGNTFVAMALAYVTHDNFRYREQ